LSITSGVFWHELVHLLRPLLWSYTIGSLIGASLLAAVSYRVALAFVVRRRRHRAAQMRPPRTS